jgi:thioesterase domain-containing protein/acyl carrier protein
LPSTAAQKEIWKLIHAHKQATTAFNLAISLQLSGKVIDSALDEAIQGLSVTHEILRGHLSSNGNEVIIESPVEIPISRIKIESPPGNQDTPLIQEYKKKEIEHPFDLHHGPLFRVTIIGSEGNGATILLGAHGSIIDEWSLSVLSRDLVKMYSSIAALEPPCTLPEYGYSDYVQYRLTPEAISQNQESIMYWHSRLALPPLPHPPRSLFYDKPHPASPTSHAHAVTHTFSNNTVTKMYSFATHHGVTLFSVLLAGFAKRIQHHTGVDDITTGVSYAGQLSCGMENTTGRFVNVIPTRFQLNTCPTFDVLCNHCHTTMISDCSEASVGIEDLAAELGYSPAKVQNLIATRCTFIQIPGKDPENSYHFIPRHATTANLELFFIEKINSLTVTVLGNDKLTTKEWLNTFAQELENEFEQNCIINKASVSEKKSSSFATTNEENILLNIWKRVLNVQDVGPDNDFYALGGNSLLAVQMINEINSTFKVKLSISIVLTLNTIAALADHIRTVSKPTQTVVITNPDNVTIKKPEWNTVVTFNNKGDLPPFFCVSGLGGNPMIFLQLSKLLGKNQPFYALQFRGVDGIMTPHNCVEDMATEFMRDIRKVQPEGPYYLGGYSFGGLVAYEMIQHLTKGGEPVGGLVLIDTFIPLHSKSVLKKSLLSRLSNLIPTGSGYNTKKLSDHLRVLGFQTRNKPDFANIFKNRFDLVASCNHLAGVQYKPQPTVANVLFIKSALGVPPDRYGHKLPFHSIHEWDNLIPPDRLDLRHTQTHHYELLNEPHLSETARNISGGLAALREKCGR